MNCKIGDSAFIIRAFNKPNIGKIVTVIEFCPAGTVATLGGEKLSCDYDAWLIRSEGDDLIFFSDGEFLSGKQSFCLDANLKPIPKLRYEEMEDLYAPIKLEVTS